MTALIRNLEFKINRLLEYFPAVIILGIRQGGKTTLSKKIRSNWKYYDLEKSSDYDYITNDFDFFFKENSDNIIIDEAQESPQLFKELRGVIDQNRTQKNRFILTGSSSFKLLNNISESLSGRVGILELGTLKFNEYYRLPLSPFYKIFQEKLSNKTIEYLRSLKSEITHFDVKKILFYGGFPEPTLSGNYEIYQNWMQNYYATYIQRDIRKLFPKLNIINYRRFISMLSELTGTIINRSDLGRSLNTSEVTVKQYLDIAHGSYIWRNIFSFEKTKSKSIIKMPKGTFRDSGLHNYLQNITKIEQLDYYSHIGKSFESFVIEEIIKGLQSLLITQWDYYFYRTKNGAEVDLIIYGDFGILPVEIKYGIKTNPKQLISLKRFINENNLPIGIIINNSDEVKLLSDKIIQIPVGLI